MMRMKRVITLLPIAALILAACSNLEPEKQWYKPNVNYTAADFDRDRAACTDKKTKTLDEDCMKERGWVALGGDIGPAVKAPEPGRGSKGKY
jgi:PBP1b-binding outer membrane lipoprotein LpoB